MARPKRKNEAGAATNFMSRARALRKLQLSLVDFRRLCILKGIYPREPNNKKKVSAKGTANTTFYYVKDVQYLMHEPVLNKFREFKIFTKRLRKAAGKKQQGMVERIKNNKPVYTLDHIVKERYPAFTDAVRDLDDALCMVFLFARMPKTDKILPDVVQEALRLSYEFLNYIIVTNSLRKVFVSIKGIYYQAEVLGETVTWVVPHQFTQQTPNDVDYRVMLTFLEFYSTLLGFVNFRCYTDLGMQYPPVLDKSKDDAASGMSALVVESQQKAASGVSSEAQQHVDNSDVAMDDVSTEESKARVASLKAAMKSIEAADAAVASETEAVDDAAMEEGNNGVDFETALPGTDEGIVKAQEDASELQEFKSLFKDCKVFLSREVPREQIEFVLRAFGASVSWSETVAGGSTFKEDDAGITHHIVDRNAQGSRKMGRFYVQPQWVFDCVNYRKRLPEAKYQPGQELPPHLSPFVNAEEGDYVPKGADDDDEDSAAEDNAADDNDEKDEGAEAAADGADELFDRELEQERAGEVFAASATGTKSGNTKKSTKAKSAEEVEEEEGKALAVNLMSKKHKRLYDRIQYSKNAKKETASKLAAKRKRLDDDTASADQVKTLKKRKAAK